MMHDYRHMARPRMLKPHVWSKHEPHWLAQLAIAACIGVALCVAVLIGAWPR